MKMRILFSMFVLFSFVKFSHAQSHAYVYMSPDYGGCSGRLVIIPVCIDLPQPISYTANIGGNIQSSNGPWISSSLCSGLVQFTLTAIDGLGNSHTLLSGSANLSASSPSITYGTQSITSPLTVIHSMMPSGPMCNGTSTFEVSGGYTPVVVGLLDNNTNSIPLTFTPPNTYAASNLCSSNYVLTLSDAFTSNSPNCTSSGNGPAGIPFTINFFDCMVSINNISCAGLCDGQAQLIPVGDGNILTMSLMGPSSSGTNIISNQCQGSVTGMLTHTSGQQAMCMGFINEPQPLNVTINTTDCLGYQTNDGTAMVSVSGGTPNYTYLWSTGGTQSFEDSLAAGQICVVVTDSNGCDTTLCDSINQPSQLVIQINNILHQTSSTPNGAVYFAVNGGVPPYTIQLIRYDLNDTINGGQFNNLSAGNYAIYVVDANGITATQPFTINNVTGIDNLNRNLIVKLYPNPVTQQLNLDAPEANKLEIYHISGKKVLERKLNNENKITMDVSELLPGSYFVRIEFMQNQKILPFIKQ